MAFQIQSKNCVLASDWDSSSSIASEFVASLADSINVHLHEPEKISLKNFIAENPVELQSLMVDLGNEFLAESEVSEDSVYSAFKKLVPASKFWFFLTFSE